MKSIKYLLLALTVGLISTSCEKEKVDFRWEHADMSKAFVQIYDMRLVKNVAANYTEYVTINGHTYQYNHSSLIVPYNFVPSAYVGSGYTVEPGVCSVKLESEDDSVVWRYEPDPNDPSKMKKTTVKTWDGAKDSIDYYNRRTTYEGTTEVALEAGKLYQIVVWAADSVTAPNVHEFGDVPQYEELDSTFQTRWASARFYNYMFDAPGVPTTGRLYFDLRNKSNGDIIANIPENGLAFGEATDYFDTYCYPDQVLNAYNEIYVRHDIRLVQLDGTESVLLKNDYWTTRPGRSYHYFYYGSLDGQVVKRALKRFTAK